MSVHPHRGREYVGRDGVRRRFEHVAYRHPISGPVATFYYFYDLDNPIILWTRKKAVHRMTPVRWRELHR